jgi:hypothetical protein
MSDMLQLVVTQRTRTIGSSGTFKKSAVLCSAPQYQSLPIGSQLPEDPAT